MSENRPIMTNLFSDIPTDLPDELTEIIAGNSHVRIERIVSRGHSSPDGVWYDQDKHEFVLVVSGEAELLFEGSDTPLKMKPGDYVIIPAHTRHRVEWTASDEDTVWLAVFY